MSAQGPGRDTLFDYAEAFSRNIGLVSREEQDRLRQTRVAIAGMGGVGGVYAVALARLGIGAFSIADLDRYEVANLNRQAGATIGTMGRAKVDVMAETVHAINPTADVARFPNGIDEGNIDGFLSGASVALDGVDFFAMPARRVLFRRAWDLGIPAMTAAPVGFGATLHVFARGGMSFEQYFDFRKHMGLEEQLINFMLGLAPRRAQRSYFPPETVDLSRRRAPSVAPGPFMCAGLVATEVANLVLRRRPPALAPRFLQIDPMSQKYERGILRRGNRHPMQQLKKWLFLRQNSELRAVVQRASGR